MLAGRLLGNKAPTSGVLDTQGYNTEPYPTERLLACKLSGYWTIERCVFGVRMFDAQGRSYALVRHSYERYVMPSSAATLRESPLK